MNDPLVEDVQETLTKYEQVTFYGGFGYFS